MATSVNSEKMVTQRCAKLMPAVCLLATAIFLTLGAGGCARTSGQEVAPRTFEQWPREDKRRYPMRTGDPAPMRPSPPSKDETMLPGDARLDDYINFAMRQNPDLMAAFYRWRSAVERLPQARTLPDPRISFGMVLDQVERSAEYMGERYTLSQMFPWFGKLTLGGDMAEQQAHGEAAKFEAARLQLADQVSRAYFEYAFRQEAVLIARENLNLLVHLESVVRAMFRAGTASLSDVSRAQIEIGRLDDQVRSLEDFLEVAASQLNAALGRPALAPLPEMPAKPSKQLFSELPGYPDDEWMVLARQHNPELNALRHEAERQRHSIALAKKNYFPDITLGVEYSRDASARMAMMDEGGADMFSGMITINIPIWRKKYDAGVREAQARLDEAHRRVENQENRLEAELKAALFAYRDSLRKIALYGDTLLPLARRSLATTETAYRAGTAGFSDLVDAQRVLLEFSLAYERAAADRAMASTRLQALVGRFNDGNPAIEPTRVGENPSPSPSPLTK